jgi:hypothetical protein
MDMVCKLYLNKTALNVFIWALIQQLDLGIFPSSYRWAFVPEVDTEGPASLPDLEENHQECKPHTIRIL